MKKEQFKSKIIEILLQRRLKLLRLKSQSKFLDLKNTLKYKKLSKSQSTSEKQERKFEKFKSSTKRSSKETDTYKQKDKCHILLPTDKLSIQTERFPDLLQTLRKEKLM